MLYIVLLILSALFPFIPFIGFIATSLIWILCFFYFGIFHSILSLTVSIVSVFISISSIQHQIKGNEIENKYAVFIYYPFTARNLSGLFSASQLYSLFLIVYMIFTDISYFIFLLIIFYFFSSIYSKRLNPLFFLKDRSEKLQHICPEASYDALRELASLQDILKEKYPDKKIKRINFSEKL